ncbi:Flagellar hook-basal body complex protein FliE [bioreactor metagenome]|uniref:Flagellar hook-basal body complex protein FliE n=1 Tax=bioreactor metagenome TaxID=1076179 RepID=A0A644T9V1_9ZZZZ|nr:flagellar hook-basal body complex protein FliE [Negativicutes bacterium]
MRIEPLKLMPVISSMPNTSAAAPAEAGKTFSQFLTNALEDVNALQQNAEKASFDLAAGKIQDVSQAVIAAEKASIALQLTMQVRNKVIDAYQEVMRMQV